MFTFPRTSKGLKFVAQLLTSLQVIFYAEKLHQFTNKSEEEIAATSE